MKCLNEIAVEMSGLCFELEHVESLTTEERTSLENRAESLVEDLEMDYAVVAFKPEVSRETQSMFFKLQKFVQG